MFSKITDFLKKEIVLVVAASAAIISAFIVPPSAEYLGYIDFKVISLLFCLMTVVGGFIKCGLFDYFMSYFSGSRGNRRYLPFILVSITFFSSMFLTNDVALIAMVPVTLLFYKDSPSFLIHVIVIETIAANLGSMAMPVGNPQNLFLYNFYNVSPSDFFGAVLPITAAGYVFTSAASLLLRSKAVPSFSPAVKKSEPKGILLFSFLFIICLLTVFRITDYWLCLAVVVIFVFLYDARVFLNVDYFLLLTFAAFFIFVGNLSCIDSIRSFISSVIGRNEFLSALLASQVISNVPAAIMLSGFTDNAEALILGTDIGGLGTIIASLASLISFRLYMRTDKSRPGKYLAVFTLYNIAALAFLCLVAAVFGLL